MINISVIRDGRTVVDKNITKMDIMRVTAAITVIAICISLGEYDHLLLEECVKAVKWQ